MRGRKKNNFIPIQKCYPEEYLEYEVINEYIGDSLLPVQAFQIKFCKNVDMVLFPHACTLLYFEWNIDGSIRVKFVGRVVETMSTFQSEGALYVLLRFPPQYIFGKFQSIVNSVKEIDTAFLLGEEAVKEAMSQTDLKDKFTELMKLVEEGELGFHENKLIDEFVMNAIFNNDNQPIEQLIQDMSYSPRYVRSVIKANLGVSVKRLYDILRLQNIIDSQIFDDKDPESCAYENGFYDSAHLNKNIRKLTGFSYTSFKKVLKNKNK